MIPKYKITMLGTSTVGKTAYMVGLHRALGLDSVEGFKMRPSGTLKEGSFGINWFHENDFDELGLQWPKATTGTPSDDGLTTWQFDLEFEGVTIAQWEWIDYRGGAILDGFVRAAAGGEQSMVSDRLRDSDAVLVFVDSIQIVQPKPKATLIKHTGASHVNHVFHKTFAEEGDANWRPPKAVVFVLTKSMSNLIGEDWRADGFKKLRDHSLAVFNDVTTLCARKKALICSRITAVDVGAKGEVIDVVIEPPKGKPIGVDSQFVSSPSGFACDLPLLCCFLEFFNREHHEAQREVHRYTPVGKSILQGALDFFLRTAKSRSDAEGRANRYYAAMERLEGRVHRNSWPI